MGDFNLNLLNYDSNEDTNNFLNLVQSHSLIPLILKLTRLTSRTNTNLINIEHTAGNLTYAIYDHLPQFAILETKSPSTNSNTCYERCYKN